MKNPFKRFSSFINNKLLLLELIKHRRLLIKITFLLLVIFFLNLLITLNNNLIYKESNNNGLTGNIIGYSNNYFQDYYKTKNFNNNIINNFPINKFSLRNNPFILLNAFFLLLFFLLLSFNQLLINAIINDLPLKESFPSHHLEKIAKKINNPIILKELNHLANALSKNHFNAGIGSKHLLNNIYYLRGKHGARLFFEEKNNNYLIIGESDKNHEQEVIDLIKKYY